MTSHFLNTAAKRSALIIWFFIPVVKERKMQNPRFK